MKHYLVHIIWDDPYPKEFKYQSEGSNIAVAIGKALRSFRKEQKGRRITTLKVNAVYLPLPL